MKITIEKTKKEEAGSVAESYAQGRAFLRAMGVDQWQGDYPALCDVLADIEAGVSWLLKADGVPAASMAALPCEPTYEHIYEGCWLTGAENYLAVHRVCVRDEFKRRGLTRALYEFAENLARAAGRTSLRADTHKDNLAMRAALKKNGFSECGKIFIEDGGERIAFEKIVNGKTGSSKE